MSVCTALTCLQQSTPVWSKSSTPPSPKVQDSYFSSRKSFFLSLSLFGHVFADGLTEVGPRRQHTSSLSIVRVCENAAYFWLTKPGDRAFYTPLESTSYVPSQLFLHSHMRSDLWDAVRPPLMRCRKGIPIIQGSRSPLPPLPPSRWRSLSLPPRAPQAPRPLLPPSLTSRPRCRLACPRP